MSIINPLPSRVLVEIRVTLPDGFLPHLTTRRQVCSFWVEPTDFVRQYSAPGPGMTDLDYTLSELFRKHRAEEERQ
jgi:hypothetical protein